MAYNNTGLKWIWKVTPQACNKALVQWYKSKYFIMLSQIDLSYYDDEDDNSNHIMMTLLC